MPTSVHEQSDDGYYDVVNDVDDQHQHQHHHKRTNPHYCGGYWFWIAIVGIVFLIVLIPLAIGWRHQPLSHEHHHHHHSDGDADDTNNDTENDKRTLVILNSREESESALSTLVLGEAVADASQQLRWSRVLDAHGYFYGRNGINHVLLSITAAPGANDSWLTHWNLDDVTQSQLASEINGNAISALNQYGSLCFDTIVPNLTWTMASPFYISTDNLAGACLDESYVRCVFTSAMEAIQGALSWHPIGQLRTATGTGTIARNSRNDVSFGSIPLPNAQLILAITSFWWTADNELVEWDQAYNTNAYQFGPVEQWTYSTLVDLQNTVTHELMHTLGMRDIYTPECAESTCYGYATYRERKKRSLQIDDQVGVTAIYGGDQVVESSTSQCSVNADQLNSVCRLRFARDLAPTPIPSPSPVQSPTPTTTTTTTTIRAPTPTPISLRESPIQQAAGDRISPFWSIVGVSLALFLYAI